MEIHVGIDPENGMLSYYNTNGNRTVDLNVAKVGSDEIQNVTLMFDEIRLRINGNFGCLCICLRNTYGNEIRKKFVEEGLKNEFKNVEIMNWETAAYLIVMPQINPTLSNGDVIWKY
uniref:Uncharacterized protein n=1 Tax=Panagrolaimus sp. ES5 TaxID=591445 RepID=A0AC34FYX8_9BILA